jgi:chloramphenicol 3-O phosphotransferase
MMTPGTVILLNGTSSSGKTSLVRALQDVLDEPFLDAGIDKFLWMLPHRYLNPPLWDDVLGRATEAGATGQRLLSGMHHAIAALARAGNHVVADHVLVDPRWLDECARVFRDLPVYFIAVHCPLPVLEQREQQRLDRTLGQARAQFDLVHAHGVYDLEVDTSAASPEQCAQQIVEHLRSGAPPQAFQVLAGCDYQGLSGSGIRSQRLSTVSALVRDFHGP